MGYFDDLTPDNDLSRLYDPELFDPELYTPDIRLRRPEMSARDRAFLNAMSRGPKPDNMVMRRAPSAPAVRAPLLPEASAPMVPEEWVVTGTRRAGPGAATEKPSRKGDGPFMVEEPAAYGEGQAIFWDEPTPFQGLKPEIEKGYQERLKNADEAGILAFAKDSGFRIDPEEVKVFVRERDKGRPIGAITYRHEAKPLIDPGDGATGAFVRGVGDSFNMLDELGGVVDTLGGTGGRESIFNSDRRFGDILWSNIDLNRAILDFDEQNHPWARTGGQIAGSALLPGGSIRGIGLAAGRAALVRGATMAEARLAARNAVLRRMTAAGGGEGAVAGFGAGEGGVIDRLPDAVAGGVTGAVTGGLLGKAGQVGTDMISSARRSLPEIDLSDRLRGRGRDMPSGPIDAPMAGRASRSPSVTIEDRRTIIRDPAPDTIARLSEHLGETLRPMRRADGVLVLPRRDGERVRDGIADLYAAPDEGAPMPWATRGAGEREPLSPDAPALTMPRISLENGRTIIHGADRATIKEIEAYLPDGVRALPRRDGGFMLPGRHAEAAQIAADLIEAERLGRRAGIAEQDRGLARIPRLFDPADIAASALPRIGGRLLDSGDERDRPRRYDQGWSETGTIGSSRAGDALSRGDAGVPEVRARDESGGDSGGGEYTTFYHGTTTEGAANIRAWGIDLSRGYAKSDFGQGFYMTKSRDEALASAARPKPASDGTRTGLSNDASMDVVEFRVPNSALRGLDHLQFASDGPEWQDFVTMKRELGYDAAPDERPYMPPSEWVPQPDMVTGPLFKRIGKDGQVKSWPDRSPQTSIHTKRAVDLFNRYMVRP